MKPYLAPMATRLLLTLLALLTGLAAQLSPAQARGSASSGTEIGVVAAQRMAVPCVRPTAIRCGIESSPKFRRGAEHIGADLSSDVPIKTVLQGVDRARE